MEPDEALSTGNWLANLLGISLSESVLDLIVESGLCDGITAQLIDDVKVLEFLFSERNENLTLSFANLKSTLSSKSSLFEENFFRLDSKKPSLTKSFSSKNHGLKAKLDGELYGEPNESGGARGRNCQTPIPYLARSSSHPRAGFPKVPQIGLSGNEVGCRRIPEFLSNFKFVVYLKNRKKILIKLFF